MECRLVLNNCSNFDITNSALSGMLQQQLKYYKFRRVPTKTGNAVFYLFFRKEEDTYYALRAAKSIKEISLVRYRHYNITAAPIRHPDDIPPSEIQYRPVPSKKVVDAIRFNFTKYYARFANKDIFKLFVRRASEQVVAQRLQTFEVHDRICKVNHWWWMNQKYHVNNAQHVQKLLDIFFT
ncbi:unnamed protein product [Rotaria magnacalcarata]|uniref:Uncharacterized protein n=1 Tax=Rotaria magnacalcarata TaxID=392030 RepID=A0A820NPL7_9BILA|nr:unnamed protein product [Rotaria magnacalcarata]